MSPVPAEPDLSGWSIVLPGAWNPAILTPDWVAEKIFGDRSPVQVELGFTIGSDERVITFSERHVMLRISAARLAVMPTMLADNALRVTSEVAVKVLQVLNHTPVHAAGVNFVFKSNELSPELQRTFGAMDVSEFAELTWEPKYRTYGVEFAAESVSGKPAIRLTGRWEQATGAVRIEFNCHFAKRAMEQLQSELAHSMTRLLSPIPKAMNCLGFDWTMPTQETVRATT